MAAMEITQISVVSIPMRHKFRGITSREMLIFKGSQRFAEWSPFLEYEDQEASIWLQSALEWANGPLPTTFRKTVKTNATLPAVPIDLIPEILSRFEGFDTVKIKVAEQNQTIAEDLARVRFVAENYPGAKIRLDANGGFSVDQAMEICMALSNLNIEYFEQPCQTVSELAELKKRLEQAGLEIKIAADESIRKASDPLEVARLQAADIAVLKVQPLGGISEARNIASESGLDIVISSALESSLGIGQGLYLAAAIPTMDYACGLGTLNLLEGDICKVSMIPKNSELELFVPEPDPELLEKYAASPERTAFWQARLARCLELL
jgi:o-succinylbenzoate synthase